jgi:hypothetical protein
LIKRKGEAKTGNPFVKRGSGKDEIAASLALLAMTAKRRSSWQKRGGARNYN